MISPKNQEERKDITNYGKSFLQNSQPGLGEGLVEPGSAGAKKEKVYADPPTKVVKKGVSLVITDKNENPKSM